MASVSFSGHRLALLAAYQEVIQEDCPADWALYTYEDDSDDLKLAASGGGGLQELSGHFENQKVMYGFCSVKDSQAALPKYVLINWVGEDVPDARKCACASHVAKVAEFFQGVDVIVNASSVEDIDAGAIGQRLSNGLARLSSPVLHRLRLREDENAEPVGTTYQKTDAAVEMKRLNREQFWEQAKREEELRKEEERKKALDERLKFEQERMEQERLEQEEREKRYREREQQIEEHRRKQQTLEAEEAKQRLKEQSIFGDQREEEEEAQMKKSESEVEEAAAIIAQRPDNPREFFKQQERVASASSCEMPTPFNHRPAGRPYCPFIKGPDSGPSSSSSSSSSPPRTPFPYITCHRTPNLSSSFPCSQMDSHRRAATAAARSPSDSSSASTPVADQIDRALDEVTSSQPQPLSREPIMEALLENEPPGETTGPLEDLVFLETKEEVVAAVTAAPAASAESLEELELAEPTGPPEPPAQGSLINLWQSDGVAPPEPESTEWELQANMRAPTPPQEGSGAILEESDLVSPPEPSLLGEGAPEPSILPADNSANLLNFDELPEPPATFCDPEDGDREASDMGGMEGSHPGSEQDGLVAQTLPMDLEELEPEQEAHLLTNGETTQKEGTQASEGYFSQSQEEEFAQSEDLSAKAPPPVFYNKPPEIDITCWDADPVPEEEEAFGGSV
ncbi:drebrin isoform X1 [Monodelphis domestica]|uniref:drebrin isoform X1 n=1 Tax=Monodelphis domestica TaxID=13616 RepID=UPI0024E1AFB8|nr:drebrin isoform X1 [Monodelphis domestica]